ncbi:iron-containing alcohol dehydrogenase [Streptomyces sp. TRM43335]|uniref:Iron-containing alcohol dehydrogenase n=1 Tax=Streptomyces taklimakanensis TaxID=2569853 RepID=A0A6G2BHY7_9ACTN|nr:daptide-type RiPP biosynthesis dehydogenase [Streptomyces taklimakanensis]MTE21824.1 iron-containing alcohol dehydrogenase [Streptomyces taklimakanensis]
MSLAWHCPTRTLFGCDGLDDWLATRPERNVAVLADARVADGALTARLRSRLREGGRRVESVVRSGPGNLEDVLALADRLAEAELVVGVGGGALLDQAKLAVVLRDPAQRARVALPQRGGLVMLPAAAGHDVPLVAVPTTVGTGAELSGAACLATPQGRRLVLGEGLHPDVAVIDPLATATLPDELLAEGVLEALFRLVSLYIGDHHDLPTEDALTEVLVRRLAELGHRVRDDRLAGRPPGDGLRLEIAKLSGLSHLGWTNVGRNRFGAKGWYLANELSWELGVRKMTAVAALLPPLWRAAAEGDERWGSARRLDRIWRTLRATDPDALPDDPVAGVTALLDTWLVRRRIAVGEEALAATVRRTMRAWGAGLPMLGDLGAADVRRVLAAAVEPEPVAC